MGTPKTASPSVDPVLAALERAPVDRNALTPEEAIALEAQIASGKARLAAGERPFIDPFDATVAALDAAPVDNEAFAEEEKAEVARRMKRARRDD